MKSDAPLHAGQRLGRYELIRPIAQGGMATVWAARLMGPRGFQKIVALKAVRPELRDEPGVEEMFLAEAQLASRIQHPNVVEVLDLGDEAGCLHLVMEWVHGAPLTTVLSAARKHGGIRIGIATKIARQVCAGLAAAHKLTDESGASLGLVHRDVSPHNVLVGFNGVVKVADFGIAKVRDASARETEFGQLKGKIAYMAPEQLRFEPVDARTDVFAVGILLYLLTTGEHPFKRDEQHETVRALLSGDPVQSPSALVEQYPARLERIVLKALAKAPEDRYPTAEALEHDLALCVPPSSDATGAVKEFVCDLLPDEYQSGVELARMAMEAPSISTATSSVSALPAEPKSSTTLRAVAVSTEASTPSAPESTPGTRSESSTLPAPKGRARSVATAFASLGVAIAIVAFTLWMTLFASSRHGASSSERVTASSTLPAEPPVSPHADSPPKAEEAAPAEPAKAPPTTPAKAPARASTAPVVPMHRSPSTARPRSAAPPPTDLKDPYGSD